MRDILIALQSLLDYSQRFPGLLLGLAQNVGRQVLAQEGLQAVVQLLALLAESARAIDLWLSDCHGEPGGLDISPSDSARDDDKLPSGRRRKGGGGVDERCDVGCGGMTEGLRGTEI